MGCDQRTPILKAWSKNRVWISNGVGRRLAQNLAGRLAHYGFPVAVNDYAPMTQVFVGSAESLVQNSISRLAGCGLPMTMNDDTPVAQVFVERNLGDVQTLGNLIHSKFLLAVERLGYDGRAHGLFR